MPLLLQLDIALLSASVAVSGALLIVALGTGLQRDVNRWFTLFIAMVLTWTVTMLVMRLALWFGYGSPLLLGEIARPRQFVLLALVGLVHQEQPQDAGGDPDDDAQKPANHRDPSQNDLEDRRCAKHDDGLHGMETDEFVLRLQKPEHKTADPAEHVGQQTLDVLRKPK